MADNSSIEWTEATWNPTTGCTKVSPGCKFCYAERMAKRLHGMKSPNYRNGFDLTVHEHMLDRPLQWRTPKRIFVNSMSDLFHEDVSEDFIQRVFTVMRQAHWHSFQILTKRAERLAQLSSSIDWPSNVWMGVSVEDERRIARIDCLRNTDANIKFLSLEPLLGPLPALDLSEIDWVIVGGESGPNAREMKPDWVLEIRDQCVIAGVPFFFKQWGGRNKKATGRQLENETWDEFPVAAGEHCRAG
jgi:protein gp37